MQMNALVDRLDALMRNARPVPLTNHVRVEKGELEALREEMLAAAAQPGPTASPAVDSEALSRAVSEAIRENIPAIAQAVAAAAAGSQRRPDAPPPGAPF